MKKFHIFILGVLVGAGLFWIPDQSGFSSVVFTKNDLPKQPTIPLFAKYLPTTTPILEKEGFFLAYNGQTKNPHWVYHKLTSALMDKKTSREECEFREEEQLPETIRATKGDYIGSGYDRGHLCAAGDCMTQKGVEDSFSLANISPQIPSFNRGHWKKLENYARKLTEEYRAVHVFSGPLYLSHKEKNGKKFVKYEVIGKQEIAVPTHFFMLLFVELPNDRILSQGFILPNQPIPPETDLKRFQVSLGEIEKASGVIFTKILP